MALNNNDQASIRGFLLGKLSEDEQQKIEERLLIEEDLFQELDISKGELVEEYCANELSQDEHEFFERNFLASPEGKERYAMAITLGGLSLSSRQPTLRTGLWQRLQNLFKLHPLLISSTSAIAVVLIVAVVFFFRSPGQIVTGPTLASNLINREQGSLPARVSIPANASELKLRLLIPSDVAQLPSYRAELDNKTEITTVKVVEQDSDAVWVVIPVSELPRGEYSLKLVAITKEGTEREIPGDYLFNVE